MPSRTSTARRKTTPRKVKSAARPLADAVAEIYAAVAAIPRGKVATYGQLAELIGMPAGHRVVARAMRTCPARLPWHRVVGRKDARRAQISIGDPEHASIQRKRLTTEGVVFDASGFIVLRRSGWLPS
jgi:methylated-DNA-protein-cysteine methyltransferase-like protein